MATTSIALYPENGNESIVSINCGTSSPKLGGSIYLSKYPNLTSFTCISNDIVSLTGYENNSNIKTIDFTYNRVSHSLPRDFRNLTSLQVFNCFNNLITGSVPKLSGCRNLIALRAYNNNFSGTLPSLNYNALSGVQYFNVGNNSITGPIPNLDNLMSMRNLILYENNFTGELPSLDNLVDLNQLMTYRNPSLTGPLPNLNNNRKLTQYQMYECDFTGPLPVIDGLSALQQFQTYKNYSLSGFLPTFNGLSSIGRINCYECDHTGPIPPINHLKNTLSTFQVYQNSLSGRIPSLDGMTKLETFTCYINNLIGDIPSVAGLTDLKTFKVYTNQLTGFAGGTPTPTLSTYWAQGNYLTQTAVDGILAAMVAGGGFNGDLDLGGATNAFPTGGNSNPNIATLVSKGWDVTVRQA